MTLAKQTVKESLSVEPQPIKIDIPEYVYVAEHCGIFRRNVGEIHIEKDDEKNLIINCEKCYRTPEEALMVAKKLWSDK